MLQSTEKLRTTLSMASVEVKSCLTNDFDTAGAIQVISQTIDTFNRSFKLETGQTMIPSLFSIDYGLILSFKTLVQDFLVLVGFNDTAMEKSVPDNFNTNIIIEELTQFRACVRNYALALSEVFSYYRKHTACNLKC